MFSCSSFLGDKWSILITNRSSVRLSTGSPSFVKTLRISSAIHSLERPPASTPGYTSHTDHVSTSPLNWRRICFTISSGVRVANASNVSCKTVFRLRMIRIRLSVHSCANYCNHWITSLLGNKTRRASASIHLRIMQLHSYCPQESLEKSVQVTTASVAQLQKSRLHILPESDCCLSSIHHSFPHRVSSRSSRSVWHESDSSSFDGWNWKWRKRHYSN